MKKIMVIGAYGQIGSELVIALRKNYGDDNVVVTGIRTESDKASLNSGGPFEAVDVTNIEAIADIVKKYDIDTVYHLAALLSAVGEKNPQLCWETNMGGLYNVLEIARQYKLTRVFWPSSMAVFESEIPHDKASQDTLLCPKNMYGITKSSGELLCDYYFKRFGVDVRGVRYPGIISSGAPPGGGTTDYAVAIFYEAIREKKYTCFLKEDTVLPMMYMPDCIRAAMQLMEADLSRIKHHSNFNVTAMSFSPRELTAEIRQHIPDFTCEYKPDFIQEIADSWPRSMDDSAAREEWGWKPEYNIGEMVTDMLGKIKIKLLGGV
ncbi:NAD-dependent epimerase/dehydratase family protein [Chloroflexota bacterium]